MQRNLIRYLKECYQADNRSQSLWNIFAKKYQFLRISSPEEHTFFFKDSHFSIEESYASVLEAAVETYRREKNLVLCSHFVLGQVSINAYGKKTSKQICSPLFFFDAECKSSHGVFELSANPEMFSWNYPLLYQLAGGRENADKVQDEFNLSKDFIDTVCLLSALNESVDSRGVRLIEQSFEDEKDYKKICTKFREQQEYCLLKNSAVLLMNRSVSSRGIIDELELISESARMSQPLFALNRLGDGSIIGKINDSLIKESDCNNIPGLLSDAQKSIIDKSSRHVLNLLIGPPGTGKSYTIAALALERFMQNESVLVVSQNEHAVDVIKDKLIDQFGLSQNAVMRAGTKDYHVKLKHYIDRITKGEGVRRPVKSKHNKLKALAKKISCNEKKFLTLLNLVKSDGDLLYAIESGAKRAGLINQFKLWMSKNRNDKYGFLQSELKNIQDLNAQREKVLSWHINDIFWAKINNTLKNHRSELIRFRKALGSRVSKKQTLLFSNTDFDVVLQTMPIWLCSLDALHKTLPLKSELFDLVIIDEATQCDIASCLPALYRAKRALIVGDPQQLRHVSFLSRDRQNRLQEKCGVIQVGFSYRDHSMVDIADMQIISQDSIVTLDEHYRSTPQIIKFSNETFYQSRLRIMTEKPQTNNMNSVELVIIKEGHRTEGVNKIEAKAVCNKLRQLVDEQIVISAKYKLSIGILSFFRAQAECIQNIIFDAFSLNEIKDHKIRSGTPYAFQGEERDIMLISCGVDSESSAATYIYLNRSDVFNVSITRARDKQVLFLSLAKEALPINSLLSRYIHSIDSQATQYQPDLINRNEVVEEFSQTMLGIGISALQNYPIAGIQMDFVLIHKGQTMAIDLVGFPGEKGAPFHLDRYKIFERAGLRIVPISFTSWRLKREEVIELIKHTFTQLQEENTISKLSVVDFSHHWTKLLGDNPVLANNVRTIEADLITLQLKIGVTQLGELIDQYQKLIWVLNKKLNPNELTYTRYTSSSEQVLLSGIENLSQIVVIQKSLGKTSSELSSSRKIIHSGKEKVLEKLFKDTNRGIESLETLALKWSKTKTFNTFAVGGMEGALSDLEDLTDRVEHYD